MKTLILVLSVFFLLSCEKEDINFNGMTNLNYINNLDRLSKDSIYFYEFNHLIDGYIIHTDMSSYFNIDSLPRRVKRHTGFKVTVFKTPVDTIKRRLENIVFTDFFYSENHKTITIIFK